MQAVYLILAFIYGCVVGSFLNVVILRLPKGQPLNGRSRCPSCGHQLGVLDLAPVLSFAMLGGKCRYCRHKISPRYALVEIITGLLFMLCCWALFPDASALVLIKAAIFVSCCIAVFVIDLENYIILDSVVFYGTAAIFLLNITIDIASRSYARPVSSALISGLLGAIAGSLPVFLVWLFSKGRWMGFGDVKLMLLLGMAVGFPVVWVLLLMAFLLGGIFSVPLLLLGKKTLGSKVPFGTFLTVAGVLCLLWGQAILHWYLALVGF